MKTELIIYKHTCTVNGKSYIGLTNDLGRRTKEHQLRWSTCKAFHRAIIKYGWDAFTTEVLYVCDTIEQARFREEQAIAEYGTMVPHGYNLTSGGEHGRLSDATKQRMSEYFTNARSDPKYKEACRQKRLGVQHTEERKRNTQLTSWRKSIARVDAGEIVGASFDKRSGTNPWLAKANVSGKIHYIGAFPTDREAALAYREYIQSLIESYQASE